MRRIESEGLYRKINGRGRESPGSSGSQLLDSDIAAERKLELLEVCSHEGCSCLKDVQVAKQDRILGGTVWSQDLWGHRKNRGA